MTAGIETLALLKSKKNYQDLDNKTTCLAAGILKSGAKRGIPITVNYATGLLTVFFTEGPVTDYQTAKTSDTKRFGQFFVQMMEQGIYLPPSQFEAWFISLAHSRKDLDRTIEACDIAFQKI